MSNKLRNLAATALGVERADLGADTEVEAVPIDRLMVPTTTAPVSVLSPARTTVVSVPAISPAPRAPAQVTDIRAVGVILLGLVLALVMMAALVHH